MLRRRRPSRASAQAVHVLGTPPAVGPGAVGFLRVRMERARLPVAAEASGRGVVGEHRPTHANGPSPEEAGVCGGGSGSSAADWTPAGWLAGWLAHRGRSLQKAGRLNQAILAPADPLKSRQKCAVFRFSSPSLDALNLRDRFRGGGARVSGWVSNPSRVDCCASA